MIEQNNPPLVPLSQQDRGMILALRLSGESFFET